MTDVADVYTPRHRAAIDAFLAVTDAPACECPYPALRSDDLERLAAVAHRAIVEWAVGPYHDRVHPDNYAQMEWEALTSAALAALYGREYGAAQSWAESRTLIGALHRRIAELEARLADGGPLQDGRG